MVSALSGYLISRYDDLLSNACSAFDLDNQLFAHTRTLEIVRARKADIAHPPAQVLKVTLGHHHRPLLDGSTFRRSQSKSLAAAFRFDLTGRGALNLNGFRNGRCRCPAQNFGVVYQF